MIITRIAPLMVLLLLVAACDKGEGDDAGQKAQSPAEQTAALDRGPRAAQTLKLDVQLAARGESACSRTISAVTAIPSARPISHRICSVYSTGGPTLG